MSHIHSLLRRLGGALALCLVLGLSAEAIAQVPYERFAGRLLDKSTGKPVSGTVNINTFQKSVTTDGTFELYVPSAQRYVIQAQKPGYVPVSLIHSGQSLEQLDVRLTKAETFSLQAGKPVNVVDSRGTNLVIPANALVDPQGRPASAPITLSLYTYDLRNEQMVGDMTGIDKDGRQVMLQSIGAVSAEFTDAKGTVYNLASGSKASISLAVDPGNPFTGTVPLWWYDQSKGLWFEEGAGSVKEGVASGQVTHFTVWNFDISKVTPSCIKVTVDPSYLATFPSGMPVKVTLPSPWSSVVSFTATNSGPFVFTNMPSNTNAAIDVNGTPYAIVNTGAPWGGTGFPPSPYSVCNGSLSINGTSTVAKVQGTVSRQYRTMAGGVTVKVLNGSTLVGSAITSNTGAFTVTVPPGTYTVTASLSGYLGAARYFMGVTSAATVTLPALTLTAGDVNGDNCVTWAGDLLPIGNNISSVSVGATDPRDINGNGALDYDDVAKAAANGDQCGLLNW